MGKGIQAERTLSDTVEDEYGYYAQRSAGSGKATQRARADVMAVKTHMVSMVDHDICRESHTVHLVELKASPDGTATFDQGEVEQLQEAGERAGAYVWLAVKPDMRSHDQWYFIHADEANETPEGNYSIRKADHEDALSIRQVFGRGGV